MPARMPALPGRHRQRRKPGPGFAASGLQQGVVTGTEQPEKRPPRFMDCPRVVLHRGQPSLIPNGAAEAIALRQQERNTDRN